MYISQLGQYDLMVVSKYFNTIEDYINLELGIPKAKGNMQKFHYNPIALDQWSRKLFTSLETLHVYNKEDDHFTNETFYKRIYWYKVYYSEELMQNMKKNEVYKHVVMTHKISEGMNSIPKGVTELGEGCFSWRDDLRQFVIPDSVTSFGYQFLVECEELTSLTIPTHWKQIGNKIYNNNSFLCSFDIPSSVETINGKEVDVEEIHEIVVSSYVTRLNDWCLRHCPSVTSLIIPTSVVGIGSWCFYGMESLKSIELPTSVTEFGECLFHACSSLTSITLNDNYNEVKGDFWNCTSLSSIVLPSTVSKIGNYAFSHCSSLTSINLENIKEFGYHCFSYSGITKENHPELPDHCFPRER